MRFGNEWQRQGETAFGEGREQGAGIDFRTHRPVAGDGHPPRMGRGQIRQGEGLLRDLSGSLRPPCGIQRIAARKTFQPQGVLVR